MTLHVRSDACSAHLPGTDHFAEAVITAGTPHPPDDPAPRALTAAAFGCLVAAQHAWLASATNDSLASYIDRAMATIAPRTGAAAVPATCSPS
jgi:hypothetical protein